MNMLKIPVSFVAKGLSLTFASLIAVTTNATEVGDKPTYAELRTQYKQAVMSNKSSQLNKVFSDDFVYLQPTKNGPDTYGKASHLSYRKSLPKLVELKIEPERVISCGSDWAIEAGKEFGTWNSGAMEFPTVARYFKLINRNAKGDWQYARTFMAWDPTAMITAPAPEFISNLGWGTWKPRHQGAAAIKQQEDMQMLTRSLVAAGDMSGPFAGMVSPFDETTGEPLSYGSEYEMRGIEDHLAARHYMNIESPDVLQKVPSETIVCEPGTAFSWGYSLYSGQNRVTGEHTTSLGQVMYMHRLDEGIWKVGPLGMSE